MSDIKLLWNKFKALRERKEELLLCMLSFEPIFLVLPIKVRLFTSYAGVGPSQGSY